MLILSKKHDDFAQGLEFLKFSKGNRGKNEGNRKEIGGNRWWFGGNRSFLPFLEHSFCSTGRAGIRGEVPLYK